MRSRFCSHTNFDWKWSHSPNQRGRELGSGIWRHLKGKETITSSWYSMCRSMVRASRNVLATQRVSQHEAKVLFNSFTITSELHFVCYREFQTEYLLCDCNILWMHRWVKERNITVRDTRCVYPKSLQAQPVTGVKQELLTCGKEDKLRKG